MKFELYRITCTYYSDITLCVKLNEEYVHDSNSNDLLHTYRCLILSNLHNLYKIGQIRHIIVEFLEKI